MKTRVCVKYFVNDCGIDGIATTANLMLLIIRYPTMVTYSRKHCDAKISDIEAKCFTTSDINKFKNEKYKRS